MVEFDAVYGVDFSAAAKDAGRNTWIAECRPTDDGLVVERLADAAEFMDCAPDRQTTLAQLVNIIGAGSGARRAFGLDFPFGLSRDLLGDRSSWREFVDGVSEGGWGELGNVDRPQGLYDGARDRAETDEVDLLRVTDEEHGGQAPTGYRIKTQTFYGISEVLARLDEDVSVAPMDGNGGDTLVLETYPRAVFNRLDEELEGPVYDTGYKRDTHAAIERRRANVDALVATGVRIKGHREFALASDDALDAVAAAVATWRATKGGDPCEMPAAREDAERYAVEGYIYC